MNKRFQFRAEQLLENVRAHSLIERVEQRILLSRLSEISQSLAAEGAQSLLPEPSDSEENPIESALFPSLESHAAWQSCQELRLQLAISLLSVYALKGGTRRFELEDIDHGSLVIECVEGGITYALIEDHMAIVLPQTLSAKHSQLIIDGLFTISLLSPPHTHWLLDLSAVREMPLNIFFSLVGHRDTLAESGRGMQLAWVRESVVPPFVFEQMISGFSLTSRFGHWFSKFAPKIN